MKKLLNAFCICFSMYSKIPVPQVGWKKENMKYVFCFLPLIGAVIGGISVGWYYLADYWGVSAMLYGAVAAVIPVLLTGGIHMDGYADTCDAIFSYGEPEKKLEILKDPRSGAFAVIYTCVYFLLLFGLFTQVYTGPYHIVEIGLGYVLSRVLSGLAVVSMQTAKGSGLAHLFSGNADRLAVQIVLSGIGILLLAAGVWFSLHVTLIVSALLAINTLIFRRLCHKQFGGITGDLAGFYLQISEILILAACALF